MYQNPEILPAFIKKEREMEAVAQRLSALTSRTLELIEKQMTVDALNTSDLQDAIEQIILSAMSYGKPED